MLVHGSKSSACRGGDYVTAHFFESERNRDWTLPYVSQRRFL